MEYRRPPPPPLKPGIPVMGLQASIMPFPRPLVNTKQYIYCVVVQGILPKNTNVTEAEQKQIRTEPVALESLVEGHI